MAATLSDNDLQLLALLASERADDPNLSMHKRDAWADCAERVITGRATSKDLLAVSELALLDSAMQRDAIVAKRYAELAARAARAA